MTAIEEEGQMPWFKAIFEERGQAYYPPLYTYFGSTIPLDGDRFATTTESTVSESKFFLTDEEVSKLLPKIKNNFADPIRRQHKIFGAQMATVVSYYFRENPPNRNGYELLSVQLLPESIPEEEMKQYMGMADSQIGKDSIGE